MFEGKSRSPIPHVSHLALCVMKKTLKQLWAINQVATEHLTDEGARQLVIAFPLIMALMKHKGIAVDPMDLFDGMVAAMGQFTRNFGQLPKQLRQVALATFTDACVMHYGNVPQDAIQATLESLANATSNELDVPPDSLELPPVNPGN